MNCTDPKCPKCHPETDTRATELELAEKRDRELEQQGRARRRAASRDRVMRSKVPRGGTALRRMGFARGR